MVTTRPEHEAAQDEYESFLAQSGLSRDDLQHIALEEVDFLDSFTAADVSGVLIGASPYNADTPAAEKTRSQLNVEEQIRELLGVILKEGIPLLATGVALQVLAAYLGTGTQEEFGEELGAVDLFLTAEGREDPVLKGRPQAPPGQEPRPEEGGQAGPSSRCQAGSLQGACGDEQESQGLHPAGLSLSSRLSSRGFVSKTPCPT